jgi:hypothetical protein
MKNFNYDAASSKDEDRELASAGGKKRLLFVKPNVQRLDNTCE